jgi:ADP-ribosylglycohydrolase
MTLRVTWVQPEDLIRHELWQSSAEGRDVSTVLGRWQVAGGVIGPPHAGASPDHGSPEQRQLATTLLDELDAVAHDAESAERDEPSDWDAIIATLDPPRSPSGTGTTPSLDTLRGAWLGRAVGCLLGKPVEKIPRIGIQEILQATGRWPLDRYLTAVGLPDEVSQRWPWNKASRSTSLEENIDGMPEDDDLNYTLMALRLVEAKGRDFTPDDVAQSWLLDLPAGRVFTAERTAYRNLLNGITPPMTARVHNPYREWIGAQIRTDLYGWVTPGQPLAAAELGWRDACVSHTRNGLYGAMFVSAMASAAVSGATIEHVLDAGASVVPPRSRMAAAIALGRDLGRTYAANPAPISAYKALEREFEGMHWVHALNNTALVAFALTASGGDLARGIGLTVMGGWDTDSNGATVGAVCGALAGADAIDPRWTEPLHDRIATSIPGCDGSSFEDLAVRTLRLV